MKSVVAGTVAAFVIAIVAAVILEAVGFSTAEFYSTSNVRL